MTLAEERSPRMTDKDLIATLRRSKLFRNYEGVFGQATGLALALRPREYWQLAHHGKKTKTPFVLCWPNIPVRWPFVCRRMKK